MMNRWLTVKLAHRALHKTPPAIAGVVYPTLQSGARNRDTCGSAVEENLFDGAIYYSALKVHSVTWLE